MKKKILSTFLIFLFLGCSDNSVTSSEGNVEIDLIIGIIIAIKVRGIINCKSKNCGNSPPNKTPVKVEICHDKNNVIPVPKR